ncbi:MAG: AAA family ATPase [Desulfobacterales bacterium]|jgi:endopeptidase Clp ATP-binding regulatory subunit ClpX|nr:AAA family ATPase [Desulfobacterales bacterium]
MKPYSEKNTPSPSEIEKEISSFLSKRFGENVKIISPFTLPKEAMTDMTEKPVKKEEKINFDLKPEELVHYLDQYIIKQDYAKAVLATKICTHFNRIKHLQGQSEKAFEMVGNIKNNVLMVGPTGVGKTYMIKLIAKKIGVPFVKGDATKFSETGYVGGDVEDLVRDLVREANDDIELAQCGIIYIDEIDKIASSRNIVGADVSRTGVQRALLKPMEETDVDLKVPHDPVSMIQEVERFRKTGKREKATVNTKNILFIMSGAFNDLSDIISKRLLNQGIGFGARINKLQDKSDILKHLKSEDLIDFGFESEFVGRLPVRAVFERLTEKDLYDILKNPNNPVMLGKRLDFASYGIELEMEDQLLQKLAAIAYEENTGARGLVSAVESAMLPFETKLPSTKLRKFPATIDIIKAPEKFLQELSDNPGSDSQLAAFEKIVQENKQALMTYLEQNRENWSGKYRFTLTPSRMGSIADYYAGHIIDIEAAVKKIKTYYEEIKNIELRFYKQHDTNIVLEEDAVDYIIAQIVEKDMPMEAIWEKLSHDFEDGAKLLVEKTGKKQTVYQ